MATDTAAAVSFVEASRAAERMAALPDHIKAIVETYGRNFDCFDLCEPADELRDALNVWRRFDVAIIWAGKLEAHREAASLAKKCYRSLLALDIQDENQIVDAQTGKGDWPEFVAMAFLPVDLPDRTVDDSAQRNLAETITEWPDYDAPWLVERIREERAAVKPASDSVGVDRPRAVVAAPERLFIFRKTADQLGEAAFGSNATKPVKWSAPIQTVHYLLSRPGESVRALDVVGGKTLNDRYHDEMPAEKTEGERVDEESVWTPEAKRNVVEKLRQLEADMRESVEAGDNESLESERAEYEKLKAMKQAATGKCGTLRKAIKTPADKASALVRKNLERAIKQLESQGHSELAAYLLADGRITVGLNCRYDPGPTPPDWQL